MRGQILAALLLQAIPMALHADVAAGPPLLEFATGLPGKQVRLSWPSQAGLRYHVEKSSDLSPASWKRVAQLTGSGPNAVWHDPEPVTTRCFYRVTQPQAEVFDIAPPLLSTIGGTLQLHGQCIPPGSVLVLEIEGQAPLSFSLTDLGGGVWQAVMSGTFVPGAHVLAARIEDGSGLTLLTLGLPLEVTETGRAADIPPSLPPAAPISAGVSAVDVAIKSKGTGADPNRPASGGPDDDCDGDTSDDFLIAAWFSKKGYDYYKARSDNSAAGTRVRKGMQDIKSSALLAAFLSKRGYDYYQAQTKLNSSASAQTSPLYSQPGTAGEMPALFVANPSSLPGEVSFQSCALSLPCPAGPPLEWVCTYRSLVPTTSGHGPGWDFSYNISIEPAPANAGSTAPRLLLHDGAGHTDTLHRQPNGTYRCPGMFREGSFSGNTFTLTFADKGTWTFKPLGASNDAGKIAAITDRNNVALACAYNPDGTLATVSDAFGRSIAVEWSGSRISAVRSGSGGAVYCRTEFSYSGSQNTLASSSCPFVPGQAPVCGPTTFTYDSTKPDPRLADNLLTLTDGAGRVQSFGYSGSTTATAIDYDVCTSSRTAGSVTGPPHTSTFELLSGGNYLVIQCDEVGRVTESVCDALHRVLSSRQYTGFSNPTIPVTSSTNRPTGKLRSGDPDFFETTCDFNSNHLPTRITYPDGSQDRVTYACDLDRACPVREGGNPRVMTIVATGGETRTLTCDYLSGFGTPESYCPGNPIGGISIKGGRNPGGNTGAQGRLSTGAIVGIAVGAALKKEEGGRHTPFHNKYRPQARGANPSAVGGIAGGVIAAKERGITINTSHVEYATASLMGGVDQDCDGRDDDCDGFDRISMNVTTPKQSQGVSFGERAARPKQKMWLCSNFRLSLRSSLGQTTTWAYDAQGNCTSETSPVAGRGALYQYNARGQCTSATVLNGATSSFVDTCTYDDSSGFPTLAVCDSTGLQLATSFLHDDQGRVTSVTDPRGFATTFGYNPLHQCVQVTSPPAPVSITTTLTIDTGGFPSRCDTEHRAPDGSLDAANPAYSSYYFYDNYGQLTRVAHEDRPSTDFDALAIESFAVCDFTYDHAGQVTRVSAPAACRAQATDLATSFSYDERGLLHHCIEGDTGNPAATVTTECDYDAAANVTRCATIAPGMIALETLCTYDGFHRPTSVTDPMGNVATYS